MSLKKDVLICLGCGSCPYSQRYVGYPKLVWSCWCGRSEMNGTLKMEIISK